MCIYSKASLHMNTGTTAGPWRAIQGVSVTATPRLWGTLLCSREEVVLKGLLCASPGFIEEFHVMSRSVHHLIPLSFSHIMVIRFYCDLIFWYIVSSILETSNLVNKDILKQQDIKCLIHGHILKVHILAIYGIY